MEIMVHKISGRRVEQAIFFNVIVSNSLKNGVGGKERKRNVQRNLPNYKKTHSFLTSTSLNYSSNGMKCSVIILII